MGANANLRETKLGLPFEPGFSLIELLIVMVLIVEAIALPSLLASKTTANRAGATENVRTISEASVAAGNGHPPGLPSNGGLGTAATRDLFYRMDGTLAYM